MLYVSSSNPYQQPWNNIMNHERDMGGGSGTKAFKIIVRGEGIILFKLNIQEDFGDTIRRKIDTSKFVFRIKIEVVLNKKKIKKQSQLIEFKYIEKMIQGIKSRYQKNLLDIKLIDINLLSKERIRIDIIKQNTALHSILQSVISPINNQLISISIGGHINDQRVLDYNLIDSIIDEQCHPLQLYPLNQLLEFRRIHVFLFDPEFGNGLDLQQVLQNPLYSKYLIQKYFRSDNILCKFRSKVEITILKQKIEIENISNFLKTELTADVIGGNEYSDQIIYRKNNTHVHICTSRY